LIPFVLFAITFVFLFCKHFLVVKELRWLCPYSANSAKYVLASKCELVEKLPQ